MNILGKILKWIGYALLLPLSYLIISLALTSITVNGNNLVQDSYNEIYLTTNGKHLDIIIPKKNLDTTLLHSLKYTNIENYFSFGWGDESFYIDTYSGDYKTVKKAFGTLFLKTATLIHLTRYKEKNKNWVRIQVSETQLKKMNQYIFNAFQLDTDNHKILLKNHGYYSYDDFYKATGSYSLIKTCNSWVNQALKESGLKACYWTPFDFGVLMKYE